MKIRNHSLKKAARARFGPDSAISRLRFGQDRQNGLAVIVVLALLAFVLIFVGANLKALASLHRDLNQVEKQQLRRLAAFQATNNMTLQFKSSATNAPSAGGENPGNPNQK